jgi:hypothetical protein
MARPLTFAKPSSEPSLAVDQVEGEQHRFDAPAFAPQRAMALCCRSGNASNRASIVSPFADSFTARPWFCFDEAQNLTQ